MTTLNEWANKIGLWQKIAAGVIFFLGILGTALVLVPTPFHMDAEAAEIKQREKNAENCSTMWRYEVLLAEARGKLDNNEIPEWRKNEIRKDIAFYEKTIKRLRDLYICE